MIRVTTPTNTFTLPENADTYDIIQVTYKKGQAFIVKEYEDGTADEGMVVSGKDVAITLTQEETKALNEGMVEAQVRVKLGNKVMASQIFKVGVGETLNEEIL